MLPAQLHEHTGLNHALTAPSGLSACHKSPHWRTACRHTACSMRHSRRGQTALAVCFDTQTDAGALQFLCG